MITLRRSDERGKADHGWLKSFHTFSFADYHDPKWMAFRSLRVINEDFIAPGMGFGAHPHRDMEIISYLADGELAHRDSLGNVKSVGTGEVQAMSAGTGVTHSEFNPSKENPTHLLQIWIMPAKNGLPPSYSEWKPQDKGQTKLLIASDDGREGSIKINQDALVSRIRMKSGESMPLACGAERGIWLQIINGEVTLGKDTLKAGDAVGIEKEDELILKASDDVLALMFDLGAY